MEFQDIKTIAKLKKEQNYDEIYMLYGTKVYNAVVPERNRIKDIERLLDDGRYYEIYEKHGEKVFKRYINFIQNNDIINELGYSPKHIKFLFFEQFIRKFKKFATEVTVAGVNLAGMFIAFCLFQGMKSIEEEQENAILYAREIEEYNNEVYDYADYINGLSLSDLEVIQKELFDMYSNVEYKEGYNDITGYERLALYYNGYGVCRNMADDFVARINAINPEYEAFVISAYIDDGKTTLLNSIHDGNLDNYAFNNIFGNHRLCCMNVNVNGDRKQLIVDPTNFFLGILEDGQIKMFVDEQYSEYQFEIKPLGNIFFGYNDIEEYIQYIMNSYQDEVDESIMEENYGFDAQMEALESIIDYDTEEYGIQKVKIYE